MFVSEGRFDLYWESEIEWVRWCRTAFSCPASGRHHERGIFLWEVVRGDYT